MPRLDCPEWQPDRDVKHGNEQRVAALWVSTTDPDATVLWQHGQGVHLRYRTHYLVDGGTEGPDESSRRMRSSHISSLLRQEAVGPG